MRGTILALGFSLALLGSAAQSQNWRASSSGQGAVAYIDAASIQRTGDKVRFWRELRWPEARTLSDGVRYDRMAAYYEADCPKMTLRSVKLRVGLGDQVLLALEEPGELETVTPGSNAEVDLRSACFDDWPKQP